jgi:ABC-type cobalamin/Fe3+-siderophores transport system ATPase subunit
MVSASGHMHDLDHASHYPPHVLAKNNGMMFDSGQRMDVVDVPLFLTFFNLPCILISDPISQTPMIVRRRKIQSHYFLVLSRF